MSAGQPSTSQQDDLDPLVATVQDPEHLDRDSGDVEINVDEESSSQVADSLHAFFKLPTIPSAVVGIVTSAIMIVLVFLLPILCEATMGREISKCSLNPFSILVYTHIGHWVVHFIIDQYLKKQHKLCRIEGYIEFYLDTKNIRRTPFYLISAGNALLLLTVMALSDYCDSHKCEDKFLKVDYLRGLMTLESLIICCLWGYYIICVKKFHKDKPAPDVLRQDIRRKLLITDEGYQDASEGHGSQNQEGATATLDPGHEGHHYPKGHLRHEVMERQAELISALHAHNGVLSEKIVSLRRELAEQTTRYRDSSRSSSSRRDN